MIESKKQMANVLGSWRYGTITVVGCLVLGGIMAGQDLPTSASKPVAQVPTTVGVPLKALFTPAYQGQAVHLQRVSENGATAFRATHPESATVTTTGVVRITLDEAQQKAAGASSPLVRLGELQVQAARQHRLGVEALYFPNIGGQLENLHFNKVTGPVLTFDRLGRTVPVDIVGKNQTALNFAAVQPVTPLIAIHQLVKIARADENIARAKAGMPVAETASKVEKNYYELLVAERELMSAEAESKKIQGKWLTASSSGTTSISTEQETDMIASEKAVVVPASRVKELTASMNEMLGLPEGTTLELVPPEPLVENLSLKEVTDKAVAANPEVVEAEQTAVKAHAASTISKLEYGPNVAIVGGWANQNALNIILPRDFSYLGLVATYTVFDFGKRERGVKESGANAQAADLGVQLTKAKVAAAVKTSYFELERSRQFTQLARRMASATQVVEASYQSENPEVESARAKVEADMFRAELEYRQAYARLKNLMGDK
jgi:outer membrane protein TolC